jgi:hypothetical protein
MNLRSYIFGIAAAVLVLVVVIVLLRSRRLRERHAIWWLIAGTLALIAGIFPGTLSRLATVVGIDEPVNLLFFTSIAILFLVSLQTSSELTTLEAKTRILAERVALLELAATSSPGREKEPKPPRPSPTAPGRGAAE